MAVSGASGREGLDLRVAVEKLCTQAGAYNALLIDEGEDVFQYSNGSFRMEQYRDRKTGEIKNERDRLRAVFILARKKTDVRSADEPEMVSIEPSLSNPK